MKRIAAAVMTLILLFLTAGCAANTYLYKSRDEDWSIKIPKEFVKDNEQYDEDLKYSTVSFKTEKESFLTINDMVDEKIEISEESLKEELSIDHNFVIEKYDTIDIKDVGKAYGAVVHDEVTAMDMIYYRLKYKDKAVSIILYRSGEFAEEQILKAKKMIGTFKGLK